MSAEQPSNSRLCANHPDRAALALCMDCGKLICHECATTWEGINYCTACLARTRSNQSSKAGWVTWLAVAAVAALLLWMASYTFTWVAIFMVEVS